MRICAVSLPFPGVTQVLRHGQRLGVWDLVVSETGNEPIPRADVYLMGAWHASYVSFVEEVARFAKVVVLWTSSAGEVGFEPVEEGFLADILSWTAVSKIWFGHQALAAAFPEKGFYAPYPIEFSGLTEPKPVLEPGKTMTFFAPATLKKNRVNTFIAALLLQRRTGLILETNQPVPPMLEGLLKYRKYDWVPEPSYRSLLAASALNLCPSWAETLSYQSVEAAFLGVPSVGSRAIPWLPAGACADPADPLAIADVGERVIGTGAAQRQCAMDWAHGANILLQGCLNQLSQELRMTLDARPV